MPRLPCALLVLALFAHADGPEGAPRHLLLARLRRGDRYVGSNTISYSLTTKVRQADKEQSSSKSVQVTERFVDKVLRTGTHGVLEIERSYLLHYTKTREDKDIRPRVDQSMLQGRKVILREKNRRREIQLGGRGAVDPMVRQTAGIEIDWRDIFNDDPVAPGDTWDADATALSRRLSAYLNCGSRAKMRVRFEEIVVREGTKHAKLYVDWILEGMRDRNLYTKVTLAGDVFLDMERRRVDFVDLTGSMIVRGAVIANGKPRIVKGEGQVVVKTTIKPARVEAAAKD